MVATGDVQIIRISPKVGRSAEICSYAPIYNLTPTHIKVLYKVGRAGR